MTSPTPPVSGPGALSRRTDRGPAQAMRDLPDAAYGENATYKDLQRGAPLAQSSGAQGAASATAGVGGGIIPMNAPSTMQGVPVTDGAALGAGAGMEALGIINQPQADMSRLVPYLPVLEFMANQEGASWATRNLVRRLKASL